MASNPSSDVGQPQASGSPAAGATLVLILAAVAVAADAVPRPYARVSDIVSKHSYCEGVEYAAEHLDAGGQVLFAGLPIVTQGVVGRVNTTGNTGTSVVSVSAGPSGVLAEHDGLVRAKANATVATDQVVLEYSLDGGRKWKDARFGTATSFAVPNSGVTISATAGTVKAGEVLVEWHGSAPLPDAEGIALARNKLALSTFSVLTAVVVGDSPNIAYASSVASAVEGMDLADKSPVQARVSLRDRLPLAEMSHNVVRMSGNPTLTFAEVGATGDTITRSAGSWISDGFAVGKTATIGGSASNNVSGVIAALSATVLTFADTDLVAEGPASGCIVTGQTTLTFAEVGATGDTITRSDGSWFDDGFRAGSAFDVTGTASNNVTGAMVASLTAIALTLTDTDLVAEVIAAGAVSVVAGETHTDCIAALSAEYAALRGSHHVNLSVGKGRRTSPYSGWYRRVPTGWAISLREYKLGRGVPTWRTSDGPIGLNLTDTDGQLVEYADRIYGDGASAAGFTSVTTYPGIPGVAYVAQDLTRATDGDLTQHEHIAVVCNLVRKACQRSIQLKGIGRVPSLNGDGTATAPWLASFAQDVCDDLANEIAAGSTSGQPMVDGAKWTPAPDDKYNVAAPITHGTLRISVAGAVHTVRTETLLTSGAL
jgi:hypothetical protein